MLSDIKITINEFGPIRNAHITLAPMMIFTGNSNLGKSYVNYLVYYFFSSFTENKLGGLIRGKIKEEAQEQAFLLTEDDIRLWLNRNVQEFMCDFLGDSNLICDVNFVFRLEAPQLNIKCQQIPVHGKSDPGSMDTSNYYRISVNDIPVRNVSSFLPLEETIALTIQDYLQTSLFGQQIAKSIILPPARGSFVGENFSFKERVAASAGMYRQFLRDYDQGMISIMGKQSDEFFRSRIKDLTGGELGAEKGNQYIPLPSGNKLSLTAAASSIKELSPLFFYLKNWSNLPLSICLEEPEAHLHPDMQIGIADLLAACLNKRMYIQLTTHSDYFLQRINQLLKIGYIRQHNEGLYTKMQQEQGLNQRYYINHDQVKAYYFRLNAQQQVEIVSLEITEKGIPMSTFFDTVHRLNERENYLDNLLAEIKED